MPALGLSHCESRGGAGVLFRYLTRAAKIWLITSNPLTPRRSGFPQTARFFYQRVEVKMKKLALIVLTGASLLGTGIAWAQYSFGDEGYWQQRGREYGLRCDNTRWCAQYTGGRGGGGTNCGFFTWNQCMATVSGVGGFCVPNQFYNPCGSAGRRSSRQRY